MNLQLLFRRLEADTIATLGYRQRVEVDGMHAFRRDYWQKCKLHIGASKDGSWLDSGDIIMQVLAVGVDDTATATQKSEGWAFIVLPEESVVTLQDAADSLSRGTTFHGSKSTKKNIKEKYEKFLTTIRDVVSNSTPRLLAHVFDDPSWHTDLKQIAQEAVDISQVQFDPKVEAALGPLRCCS